MILSAENVDKVFRKCLFFNNQEVGENTPVIVDGIRIKVGFHPGRLDESRAAIVDMLMELPSSFHEKDGGGMSFLNMCENKDGLLWTGDHSTMEALVMLGVAIGRVSYLLPREMWDSLPGAVPYITIK